MSHNLVPIGHRPHTVNTVVSMSARQNNGQPRFFRFCQPEQKACVTGVSYKEKDGTDMAIKVTKDAKEIVLSREICSFNSSNDVRICVDWDKERYTAICRT
jgi:hypothetical protein